MLTFYPKARKIGVRSQRVAMLTGKRTRLLSLEEAAGNIRHLQSVYLGNMEIPIEDIAGTLTRLRARSFSADFYPVLSEKSEFARKWEHVYHYQEDQGISDPIKAYEYLRKFYVQEGNKRVSVLRYFGAVSVSADVYRLLPVRDGSEEIEIYYEFIDFYDATGIFDIYFSQTGRFQELAEKLGHSLNHSAGQKMVRWPDAEIRVLKEAFQVFREQYRKFGEKKNVTEGDAFLVYLGFYPLDSLLSDAPDLIHTRIGKLWNEFSAETVEANQVLLKEQEFLNVNRPSFLHKTYTEKDPLRVAFLYDGDYRNSGWLYGHELGRNHVEEIFHGQVRTRMWNATGAGENLRKAIDEAAASGAEMIFTASPAQMKETSQAAIHYPDIRFLNCSLNLPYNAVRTYYSRMYEAKFLLGMIAAQASRDHRIAYLANYPIYGTIANINAFAIGASMIDPEAEIWLRWNTLEHPDEEMDRIVAGIPVVSGHDLIKPDRETREYGVFLRDGDTVRNLAAPFWDWGKYYELLINSVLDGSYDRKAFFGDEKALNYWFGMTSGVVDILLSQHLEYGSVRLVSIFKKAIHDDDVHPFDGKILDQEGNLVREDGKNGLSWDEIMTMNWLCRNIHGRIPKPQELMKHAELTALVSNIHE